MTQHDTPGQDILAAARKLQEDKLVAIQRLADTRARIATIQAQMTDAEREDANAYQAAVRGGWTEAELKAVGIAPPARQAPGRPRGKGRARAGSGNALVDSQLRREAEASGRLDRDQTHAVGVPGMPDVTAGVPADATPVAG